MEGPLVSDTTEVLGSASPASEDVPAGISAPPVAAGGSSEGALGPEGVLAPASKSRGRSGAGLSSLLMPELQRIAQTMGIPGAGRMRKGQLVEAIEARQGGGPRQEAGTAKQGSDQRVASAGADSTRPRKQGAMEPDTNTQSGIGAGATSGLGDSVRGGIGTDEGAGQQLSFDQETVTDRPSGRTRRASAQQVPVQQAPSVTEEAAAAQATVVPQDDTAPGESAPSEAQRGDRRRRNSRRDEPSARSREQSGREQSGREQSGRDQGARDNGGRDQGVRDNGGRDQGSRDQSGRDQSARDQGGRDNGGRDQSGRDQGGRDQGT